MSSSAPSTAIRVQVTAADGVLLNCEVDEAERKTPTVVFVHGWVESIDVWHYQRLALRGKVRMVFVDLRSHGESGRSYHRQLVDPAAR